MYWDTVVYAVVTLLILIILWEYLREKAFIEGFTDGLVPEFFGRYFPRRYDIVPGQIQEVDGWIRNANYFEGYVDVQKLGYKGDFCRVIEKQGMPESRIVACALAGQEGLDSMIYRSESQRAGMQFSRDDYFRDVNDDGRDDYCRILKVEKAPNDRWEALAVLADVSRFKQSITETPDNSPPPHIADLLWFYEGIMVWFRWFDDMLDYGENAVVKIAGGALVDESERRRNTTKGFELNRIPSGSEQYLKIGENAKLEFDSQIRVRNMRAFSVWAYFDEFTQNARIFDFGNGAGRDNVLLGIEGRGNTSGAFGTMNPRPSDANAVCQKTPAREVSPQTYLMTSDANVDFVECPGPEPIPSLFPEDDLENEDVEPTANLLFEIWDSQQRKMRIRVLNAIPLKKWVHIALTTNEGTSIRPTWQVYINGNKIYEEQNGHLPLKSYLTQNYIGRSNWEGISSQYEGGDERMRGALFDFRMYRTPMSASKIARTIQWGREKLGIGGKP